MLHTLSLAAVLFLAVVLPAQSAQNEPTQPLQYEVVGRAETDGERPVLLALPPGDQSLRLVEFAEQLYWEDEAVRLGWTVISPSAPNGQSLSGPNLDKVMELVSHIEKTYDVENGRVHLAGVSNGGRTALELALAEPDRFASLNLLPGIKEGLDTRQLETLTELPIAMYVGGNDRGWLVPMTAMAEELTKLGHPPALFRVFEGEGHTPRSLTGKMLFKELEMFRMSAAKDNNQ